MPPERLKARNRRSADATDAVIDDQHANTGTALIVTPRPHDRPPPARRLISSHLNTQILAQKLPGKSERRLARYFPERVLRAYRQAATPVPPILARKSV